MGECPRTKYDAAKVEAARAWVESAAKQFGRIDGLVNNAGIYLDFERLGARNSINCDLSGHGGD